MFSGQWKEADEKTVCIDIPDDNITKDGMCELWLFRPFAGSPPGLFTLWLVRPKRARGSSQGVNQPGANKPGGERARGRTSQGANRQSGEKARHRVCAVFVWITCKRKYVKHEICIVHAML